MQERFTKRYLIHSLDGLALSSPLRYERYYISRHERIQKRGEVYEHENCTLTNHRDKKIISLLQFEKLKEKAVKTVIRDSYLVIGEPHISIKVYHENYEGFMRAEVIFSKKEQLDTFVKKDWFGEDITETPLAFDSEMIELTHEEFSDKLSKLLV